jgi:transposase
MGLVPRPDVLPVLALALEGEWEERGDGLWLREEYQQRYAARTTVQILDSGPPYRANALTPAQRTEATELLQAGRSPQQVADHFEVSYWVIFRLMKRTLPKLLPRQQQPKLSLDQMAEARRLLASGLSMRKVAKRFPGVSYGAIWRMMQRDAKRRKGD